jgi:hypothetical protein
MTSDPPLSNPHPYHRVNLWSRLFHSWISSLLNKSHKKHALQLTDLYDVLPELESTKLTERLEANWLNEIKQTKREPNLAYATLKTIGWRPLFIGLLLIPTVNKKTIKFFN